jgi:hypothetical protein
MNNKNTNGIITKTKKDGNYIVASFKIYLNDANCNIRIINSYEAFQRDNSNFIFDENMRNEKEIKQCKIQV